MPAIILKQNKCTGNRQRTEEALVRKSALHSFFLILLHCAGKRTILMSQFSCKIVHTGPLGFSRFVLPYLFCAREKLPVYNSQENISPIDLGDTRLSVEKVLW